MSVVYCFLPLTESLLPLAAFFFFSFECLVPFAIFTTVDIFCRLVLLDLFAELSNSVALAFPFVVVHNHTSLCK